MLTFEKDSKNIASNFVNIDSNTSMRELTERELSMVSGGAVLEAALGFLTFCALYGYNLGADIAKRP